MWPQKKGLGVQLSYGVKGNGIIIPNPDKEREEDPNSLGNLEFPILDEPQLNRISEKSKRLIPKQLDPFNTEQPKPDIVTPKPSTSHRIKKHKKKQDQSVKDFSIANNILVPYNVHSDFLDDTKAFDPTFGNTIEFFDTKEGTNKKSWKSTVAYATGSSGNILNISLVLPLERVQDCDKEILLPIFNKGISVNVTEQIRQIQSYKPLNRKTSNHTYDYLLVRTLSKVLLLNCLRTSNETHPFKVSLVDELKITALKNHPIADLSWSPDRNNSFILIDIKGNTYRVAISKKTKFTVTEILLPEDQVTFDSSLELSNWHRSIWTKSSELFVSSRTSLIKIDLNSNTSHLVITANTWSNIQDLCVPSFQDQFMFLLTSRELIWIDISDGFKRLLSWKHFLAESDPSLKLVVHKDDDKFICLIYSQLTPLVICLVFGIKCGRPYCVSSPSVICLQENKVAIQNLALVPLDLKFYKKSTAHKISEKSKFVYGLFDLRINLEINVNALTYRNIDPKDPEFTGINFSNLANKLKSDSLRHYTSLYFEKFTKGNLLPLISSVLQESIDVSDQITKIQQLAFKLGEGGDTFRSLIEKRNLEQESTDPLYESLLDIADETPSGIIDSSEVDSMLEQLRTYYNENNVNVVDLSQYIFSKLRFFKYNPELSATVKKVYKLFQENYYLKKEIQPQNSERSFKELVVNLVLSMIKLKPADTFNYYQSLSEEYLRKASPNTKTILDDWDFDFEEIPTVADDFNTQTHLEPVISSIPAINITSQDTSTQKKIKSRSKRQKHDMRRDALKGSSQIPKSQEPSSSQLEENSQDSQSQQRSKSNSVSKSKSKSNSKSNSQSKSKSKEYVAFSTNMSQPLTSPTSPPLDEKHVNGFSTSQPSGRSTASSSQKRHALSQMGGSQRSKKKRRSGFA